MAVMVPSAHLTIPDGWEVSLELRATAPEEQGLTAPLAMKSDNPRPRANVTISRRAAEPTTPKVMLNAFLKHMTASIKDLKTLGRETLRFADGVESEAATVSYEVEPGVRVVQRHVYRIDDGIVTHFVASAVEQDRNKLDRALKDVLVSFRP